MNPPVRSIVAVVRGAFVAFVLIMAIEFASSAIYLPKDVDRNDMEALKWRSFPCARSSVPGWRP
jgi:hypothetical protein